jgi:hypothetical protein
VPDHSKFQDDGVSAVSDSHVCGEWQRGKAEFGLLLRHLEKGRLSRANAQSLLFCKKYIYLKRQIDEVNTTSEDQLGRMAHTSNPSYVGVGLRSAQAKV